MNRRILGRRNELLECVRTGGKDEWDLASGIDERDNGTEGVNRTSRRELEVDFDLVGVILFKEHCLDVKLLGRLSVEFRTCSYGGTGLILDAVSVTVGVGGHDND
jgi:hypothetical protein